jgi:hypothetical protein
MVFVLKLLVIWSYITVTKNTFPSHQAEKDLKFAGRFVLILNQRCTDEERHDGV